MKTLGGGDKSKRKSRKCRHIMKIFLDSDRFCRIEGFIFAADSSLIEII
jgi:hypothetical protein